MSHNFYVSFKYMENSSFANAKERKYKSKTSIIIKILSISGVILAFSLIFISIASPFIFFLFSASMAVFWLTIIFLVFSSIFGSIESRVNEENIKEHKTGSRKANNPFEDYKEDDRSNGEDIYDDWEKRYEKYRQDTGRNYKDQYQYRDTEQYSSSKSSSTGYGGNRSQESTWSSSSSSNWNKTRQEEYKRYGSENSHYGNGSYSSNQYSGNFNNSEYKTRREKALEVLGLGANPQIDEIKKRYRKLSMIYHPDLNKGDKAAEKKFIELNDAYKYLLELEKYK